MVVKDGKHKSVGFVDLGEAHNHMEYLIGKYMLTSLMFFIKFVKICIITITTLNQRYRGEQCVITYCVYCVVP